MQDPVVFGGVRVNQYLTPNFVSSKILSLGTHATSSCLSAQEKVLILFHFLTPNDQIYLTVTPVIIVISFVAYCKHISTKMLKPVIHMGSDKN